MAKVLSKEFEDRYNKMKEELDRLEEVIFKDNVDGVAKTEFYVHTIECTNKGCESEMARCIELRRACWEIEEVLAKIQDADHLLAAATKTAKTPKTTAKKTKKTKVKKGEGTLTDKIKNILLNDIGTPKTTQQIAEATGGKSRGRG